MTLPAPSIVVKLLTIFVLLIAYYAWVEYLLGIKRGPVTLCSGFLLSIVYWYFVGIEDDRKIER